MKNKFMQVIKYGWAIILFTILFSGCGAQSKLTKYLRNDLNDSAARYWADFIEKNGINAIDDDGDTLLYYAIEKYRDPVLVDLCLKAKADFRLVPRGKQDLVIVAFRLRNEAIWDVLFKNGFPVRNKGEGVKYDLLYSCFDYNKIYGDTKWYTEYAKFFLTYYKENELDYRGYTPLNNLSWGSPEINEIFFEMDRKGYKPHIKNVRNFIYDYIVNEDEPSLKADQFECLKKYISDEWYKKEKSYIIDLNRFYIEKEKNQQERLFKVLDFIFERGYKIEDAYLADWVKECFEHAYINEDTQLNYALRALDYCKNHNVELNVVIEKNNKTEYILDHSIDEMYHYWQNIETSKKRDETPWKSDTQRFDWYTGIVNSLLEKGINSVSKTNSNGQEYSVILYELGLSDKINIADE